MHRQQLQFLHTWLKNKNHKPLIIGGARQVGKSALMQYLPAKNHQTLCNVNLERYPELASIFSGKDPQQILQQIEFLPNIKSIADDTAQAIMILHKEKNMI